MDIQLTRGYVAIVDEDDYESINQFKWYSVTEGKINNLIYAARPLGLINGKRRTQKMHRFIIKDIPNGYVVDHINGNGLDNRKCNLRVVTHRQNIQNTIGRTDRKCKYKGICLRRDGKKYVAQIKNNDTRIYLGCFNTEDDAANAYNEAAQRLYGEFARLNIINTKNQ